jgi:hypothetical protein
MFILDEEDICSKEEQKQEALYRMNKLNILPDVIDTFEKSNEIKCSDYGKIIAAPENTLKRQTIQLSLVKSRVKKKWQEQR